MLTKTQLATMKYKPSLWSLCASFQTLAYLALAATQLLKHKVRYQRRIFTLSDGGEIALDWVIHQDSKKQRDIVMVIPGLSGDEKEQYCISAAGACLKRDLDCVVVNYRGMSGVTLKSAKIDDGADVSDIHEVVQHLHQTYCQG